MSLNYNRAKFLSTLNENKSVNCAVQKYIASESDQSKVSDFKM